MRTMCSWCRAEMVPGDGETTYGLCSTCQDSIARHEVAVFDLVLGPDELVGVPQMVRLRRESDDGSRVVFRAIGGGPTNVPRWQHWPAIVYQARDVASMLKTGALKAVRV